MTWLAASLYALGVVGAVSLHHGADGRDVPASVREWVVVIGWPIAVSVAVCLAVYEVSRRGARR
jgi:hypothetical protein